MWPQGFFGSDQGNTLAETNGSLEALTMVPLAPKAKGYFSGANMLVSGTVVPNQMLWFQIVPIIFQQKRYPFSPSSSLVLFFCQTCQGLFLSSSNHNQFVFWYESSRNQAYGLLEVFPISNFLGSTAPWHCPRVGWEDARMIRFWNWSPYQPSLGMEASQKLQPRSCHWIFFKKPWVQIRTVKIAAQNLDIQIFQIQKSQDFRGNVPREIRPPSWKNPQQEITESPRPWAHLSFVRDVYPWIETMGVSKVYTHYREDKKWPKQKKHTAKNPNTLFLFPLPFCLTKNNNGCRFDDDFFGPVDSFLTKVSLFGTIMSFVWLELVLDRPVDAAIAFTVGELNGGNKKGGKWKLFFFGRLFRSNYC